MGKFQAMHKYFVVFLALVAFHDCHLTHGRKIMKPLNTNIVGQKDNPHPTLPPLKTSVYVPTPSSKKVDTPKMTPNYGVAISFEDSSADTNAFRPTTPGSSPGASHKKFTGEDNDMKGTVVAQSPDVKVSMTGVGSDHSPSVGHRKFVGEDNYMKAMVPVQSSDVKVSVTGVGPGHSPSIGHAYPNHSPYVKVSVTGVGPGHSPGVGHRKFIGEDNHMKAMMVMQSPDVKISVTEVGPGHSPSIGHAYPNHSPSIGHAYPNNDGQLN